MRPFPAACAVRSTLNLVKFSFVAIIDLYRPATASLLTRVLRILLGRERDICSTVPCGGVTATKTGLR